MGKHGDSTTFIYRTPPTVPMPDQNEQRRIIRMGKLGMNRSKIAKMLHLHLSTVNCILDRGVVFLIENDDRPRCPECGCKLLASPCLRCELLTRNN